jgi:1,5-anhydro-D-fructose reductase (1,5-anhydro-D-mannitol-forming)
MGQDPGGVLTLLDGTTGAPSAIEVPDAEASPFLNQVCAFARALRSGDHAEYSIERDLHTMRLLTRAYAEADAPASAIPTVVRGAA